MKLRKFLSAALCAALLACLLPAAAYADGVKSITAKEQDETAAAEDTSALALDEAVVNPAGETLYNDGDIVFNNYGTVYNNGGIVFNNGGTVFNNSGTVYNNGGIVYNNGALVYNNAGTVFNNDGSVEDNAAAPEISGTDDSAADDKAVPASATGTDEAAAEDKAGDTKNDGKKAADDSKSAGEKSAGEKNSGPYKITLSADYSAFADITGLDSDSSIDADAECVITPKEGVIITDAVTTSGACSMDENGTVTLSKADRDGKLTLKFRLAAPVVSPGSDSYGDDRLITLSAAEGADIYYTTDGSTPTEKSDKYKEPFEIDSSVIVKAIAVMDGARTSETAEESYVYPAIPDVEFDTVAVGYRQPDAKPLVVKNTGLGELVIESVALEGGDSSSFILSTTDGGTVATGQSDNKTWTVVPKKGLAAGEYETEAVFTLSSGDKVSVDIDFKVSKTAAKAKT